MRRRLSPEIETAIQQAAQQAGIDPQMLRTFVLIESGGNPNNVTGSYHGLLQLSQSEFARHGGTGNIFDPAANLAAGAAKLRAEMAQFQQTYGRPPTGPELYMIHQQGVGGAAAHMANPDAPAWQSMAGTAEGRMRGPRWAQQAIWGNVPTDLRAQYGDVNSITSRDFLRLWEQRYARINGGAPTTQQPDAQGAAPAPHDPASAPPADQLTPRPEAPTGIGGPAIASAAPAAGAPSPALPGAVPAAPAAQPSGPNTLAGLFGLGVPNTGLAGQPLAPNAQPGGMQVGGLAGGMQVGPFSIGGATPPAPQQAAAAAANPVQLNMAGRPVDMQRLVETLNRRARLGLG